MTVYQKQTLEWGAVVRQPFGREAKIDLQGLPEKIGEGWNMISLQES